MTKQRLQRLLIYFAVLSCGGSLFSFGQQVSQVNSAEPLSLPAYMEELERWTSALETLKPNPGTAAKLRQQIPQRWTVAEGSVRVPVPTSWLRAGLSAMVKDPKSAPATLARLLSHVRAMRGEAQQLAETHRYPDSSAPRKLNAILARPEFSRVHGPTWADRLADRINQWLSDLMERFGTGLTGHRRIVAVIFWIMLIGAAGTLLVWMARRLLQRSKTQHLELPPPEAALPRSSRDLGRKAREAAARGDFREAVRCGYWAAIHRLEELGLWKVDLCRTHREYLRLVGSDRPQREPLAALTRQFESVWYAARPMSEAEFQSTVNYLEKLGCPLPSAETISRS
jgi:Domain of unknown function (DUF4129)